MTLQDTITLLNAGYTKEEIEAMGTPAQQVAPTPAPAQQVVAATVPTQPAQVAQVAPAPSGMTREQFLDEIRTIFNSGVTSAQPAPTPAPAAPVQPAQAQPVTLSPEQLQQLVQGVAVQTASGTVEMPPTAQDSLAKMFESVVGAAQKEE